jgi:ABC-type multidrug transport system fused ATPase/permease subunit
MFDLMRAHRLVVRTTSTIRIMMVRKMSRLRPEYIKYLEIGSVTNLLTIDNHRIGTAVHLAHTSFGVLYLMVLLTVFLSFTVNWIALCVPLIVLVALGICHEIDKWVFRLISKKMKISDRRGDKTKEIIAGIKIIKFNALENIMANILKKFKAEEKTYCVMVMMARG